MKTVTGVNVLKPDVEEGNIRVTLVGEKLDPGLIAFEFPMDEFTHKTLVEIANKVFVKDVKEVRIQVYIGHTPFESSSDVPVETENLPREIRIAVRIAAQEAYNNGLTRIYTQLQNLLDEVTV